MKKISPMLVLVVSILAPLPAFAASCMDLWIARNSIFNNKGYCFGTNLGTEQLAMASGVAGIERVGGRCLPISQQN